MIAFVMGKKTLDGDDDFVVDLELAEAKVSELEA